LEKAKPRVENRLRVDHRIINLIKSQPEKKLRKLDLTTGNLFFRVAEMARLVIVE
jgi:hypothetical protein